MKLLRVLVAVLSLTLGGGAYASYQASGNTFTYSKVSFAWGSTAPVFSSCNELLVEFTGLFTYPMDIMVYGRLRCPAMGGEYYVFGAGGVTPGTFNMSINIVGFTINCYQLPEATLTGSCKIYDPDLNLWGTSYIIFR